MSKFNKMVNEAMKVMGPKMMGRVPMEQKVSAPTTPIKKTTVQLKLKTPQLSQRDAYNKIMNRAMKKGGSNGVGVGK